MPAHLLLFALLLIVNVVSIFGYATFALHPELLSRWPWTAEVFAVSYPLFARGQILIAAAAWIALLTRAVRLRWVLPFVAVFLISGLMEFLSTTYGVPFGKYEYTGLLGAKILGKVPWLIPLSWFFMAVPSLLLAREMLGRDSWTISRISMGAVILLSWDLSLDPAMSHLTPFWLWETPGTYYGMPIGNLAGWFFTGVMIMAALEAMRVSEWSSRLSPRATWAFYLANLLLPFGMSVAAGLWGAVVLTLGALALGLLIWKIRRRPSAQDTRAAFEPSLTSS